LHAVRGVSHPCAKEIMVPTRSVTSILLPGGLIVCGGSVFLRPGVLPGIVHPYVEVYPYLVFGAGLLLGWYFHRTRVILSLVALAIVDMALRARSAGFRRGGRRATRVRAAALLVPLNLALYGMFKERGLFTAYGMARMAFIALQVAAWARPSGLSSAAHGKSWNRHYSSALDRMDGSPQVALMGFALAWVSLAGRAIARRIHRGRHHVGDGVGFPGFARHRVGWSSTLFLATGEWRSSGRFWRRHTAWRTTTSSPAFRAAVRSTRLCFRSAAGTRWRWWMWIISSASNDLFGHEVGDQALRMVAAKLGGITGGGRPSATGVRSSLCSSPARPRPRPYLTWRRPARRRGVRVHRPWPGRPRKKPATRRSSAGPRVAVSLTVSIGVAERDERKGITDAYQVLRTADKAVYRAKSAGRNRLMV